MTRLRRYTSSELRLAVEAFLRLCWTQARLKKCDPVLKSGYQRKRDVQEDTVAAIVLAVERAAKLLRNSNCLTKAMVSASMLSNKGHDCEVRIGVKSSDNDIAAHAWVTVGEEVVLGGGNGSREFEILPNVPSGELT